MLEQLQKSERLEAIVRRVGFALWQIQELEGSTALYFVLRTQASQGMERAAGNVLVDKAQSKTFGATIKQLEKATLLAPDLVKRYVCMLEDRNWLVHRSRSDSRGAIHDDQVAQQLVLRLDNIADEATALLQVLGGETERFAQRYGVSKEFIDRESQRLLKQWQEAEDENE